MSHGVRAKSGQLQSRVSAGVSYAFAEEEARSLVLPYRLPVLPTPMGKGVISDLHPQCVAAARSRLVQPHFPQF